MLRMAHPDLDFPFDTVGADAQGRVVAAFDVRLFSQALTNILKNAVEAVQAVPEDVLTAEGKQPKPPRRTAATAAAIRVFMHFSNSFLRKSG